jgi:hypothetical protein
MVNIMGLIKNKQILIGMVSLTLLLGLVLAIHLYQTYSAQL